MRQIKFRGKRVDTGDWLYGNIQVPVPPFDKYFMWDGDGRQHEVLVSSVGQLTSVEDSEKNVIYEGDIVEAVLCVSYKFGEKGFVVYNEDCGGFVVEGKWRKNQHYENLTCDVGSDSRIIGNIHDNHKLLK